MAVAKQLRAYLCDKNGNSAIEFVFSSALLILVFSVLLSAFVYVTQFYSASYICRRVVRTIEVNGLYDEQSICALSDELGGTALENLTITVDAPYFTGTKIQLCDEFTVHLKAIHRVNLMMFGDTPIRLDLPINIDLSGRSEVFWK